MEEIDPNKYGDLLQDTYYKLYRQENAQENLQQQCHQQPDANQQSIS